jgi:serine protease Do
MECRRTALAPRLVAAPALAAARPADSASPTAKPSADMRPHLLSSSRGNAARSRYQCTAAYLALVTCSLLLLTSAARAAGRRRSEVVEVVERVRAAVVNIHSERTVQGPAADELFSLAPSQNRINGMGTGVIIDPRGYIVTNQHVVEDVSLIRVRLADGTAASARVVARDTEGDLALLKIDVTKPLAVMPMGTATDLMVGETVIAIGNAYGYEHTVTVGVVSAIKRDVTLNKEVSYKSLIQTDASINPGNSGGPLLNVNGELIGINVAIRAGAQGIGFAIPVDSMLRAAADMLSIRKRNGTWHGLVVKDTLDLDPNPLPVSGQDGAVPAVQTAHGASVPTTQEPPTLARRLVIDRLEANGPGWRAGLQKGDVIVQVADQPVHCALELERALLDSHAQDHVSVVVQREGKDKRLELILAAAERVASSTPDVVWHKLGLRLSPVGGEVVSQINQQLHGGLAVTDLRADGPAAKAGIQRGDILVGLHQWEMLSLENIIFVLNHPDLASFNPLRFYIVRSGQVHRGWIQQVD